jgi:hypothetical protein
MDFLAIWYIRICEFRDALVRNQTTGATLIPDFLSVLYSRVCDFPREFGQR